jgi:cytochrome c-type biogenesis protein
MDQNHVTLLTAFIAGFLSFLSPCVIPVLPTYTAFLTGAGRQGTGAGSKEGDNWHFLLHASCFFCGFILVFVVMGATASYFGQVFLVYQQIIRQVGAFFMVLMGLHLLGVLKVSWLEREYRPLLTNTLQGPIGAFILGVAFTAGWTPCTGPILASILLYASVTTSLQEGALLLFVYAMGFSVPFLLVSVLFKNYFYKVRKIVRWLPLLHRLAGVVLLIIGVILYFDLMQRVFGFLWG